MPQLQQLVRMVHVTRNCSHWETATIPTSALVLKLGLGLGSWLGALGLGLGLSNRAPQTSCVP